MILTRPRFGVEIEYTSADVNLERMAQKLTEAGLQCAAEGYNHHTRSYWKLTTDSSCGAELVSPPLWYEDRFSVAEAIRVLKRNGARINETCGLHVHHEWPWVQMREPNDWQHRQGKEERIVALYERCLPLLRVIVDPSRFADTGGEGSARYCLWNNGTTSRDTRYYAVNFEPLEDRTTIEFRQHHATLDAEEVLAWIEFTRQVVHAGSVKAGGDVTERIPMVFEKLSSTTWRKFNEMAAGEHRTMTEIVNEITTGVDTYIATDRDEDADEEDY